jgi:hypothetical protein
MPNRFSTVFEKPVEKESPANGGRRKCFPIYSLFSFAKASSAETMAAKKIVPVTQTKSRS